MNKYNHILVQNSIQKYTVSKINDQNMVLKQLYSKKTFLSGKIKTKSWKFSIYKYIIETNQCYLKDEYRIIYVSRCEMNTNQEATEHGRVQTPSHALRLDARQPNRHESVNESLLPTKASARPGNAHARHDLSLRRTEQNWVSWRRRTFLLLHARLEKSRSRGEGDLGARRHGQMTRLFKAGKSFYFHSTFI